MTDTDTDETLLGKITELTDFDQEDGESAEDYKQRIVDYFKEEYPNTKEGNDAFEELDDDVRGWVNEATTVVRDNRGARNKKRLPPIEGLAEDEEKKRGRAADGKKPKVRKEGAGRAFGAKKDLAPTFEAPPNGAGVSKLLTRPLKAHGFKKQKELSKAGHIVYRNEAGQEIHVGRGKEENNYMMGWRPAGERQHRYGGPALEEYLSGKAA